MSAIDFLARAIHELEEMGIRFPEEKSSSPGFAEFGKCLMCEGGYADKNAHAGNRGVGWSR